MIALPIFVWWLASSVLGLLALPVAWRVFTRLPDRGLGLARLLGILISGFALWLGGSIGLWPNGPAGSLAGIVVLAAASVWAWRGCGPELRTWLREHLGAIAATEGLFLAAFVLWAVVRAFNPDIVATEKPMELAFLNSVLRSPTLPPADPWLSGYAISYYYFGYILLGHLATLTATPGSMAFNLGVALWFGLAVTATYSLLVNLLSARDGKLRLAGGLLGPLFVIITGNLAGFLEMLHSLRLGWRTLADGTLTSRFWPWLDILDLSDPPGGAIGFLPTRYLWWWRASRVVHDASLTGDKIEVIDEFPFFSFLLADSHPHLLALPFVLLAVGFALQVYLVGRRTPQPLLGPRSGVPAFRSAAWMAAVVALGGAAASAGVQIAAQATTAEVILGSLRWAVMLGVGSLLLIVSAYVVFGRLPVLLSLPELGFAAIAFGALAFLNTWDLPIYLFLLLVVLAWQARSGSGGETLRALLATAVTVGVAALLLYLPWFLSFRSQLGGILPNLAYPTRLSQFGVMFATSLVPLVVWLLGGVRPAWRREDTRTLLLLGLGLPLALFAASWILAGLLGAADPTIIDLFLTKVGAASWREALAGILSRRLTRSWTALFLGAVIALAFILLRQVDRRPRRDEANAADLRPFIAMLVGIAGLLALAPEFVYLRDGFGDRMNTIFKFYFAGWILWGLAAAYAVTELWPRRSSLAGALRTLTLMPVLLGLAYPILATWTITRGFTAEDGPTLDGAAHLARSAADDYAAIQWINAGLPRGVIAEAARAGSSYSAYGRIATHTGLPAVLGWDFHEWQWRGSWTEQGSRVQDLATLYMTRDWNEARVIMDRYDIDYVYIGPLEASTFQPIAVTKFGLFLKKIYDNGAVVIFARPEAPVP